MNHDERVLVLTPGGRDFSLASEILDRQAIAAFCCADARQLGEELAKGAAALLIAEEALTASTREQLRLFTEAQPPWSDLPMIVLAHADQTRVSTRELVVLSALGNVTVLERPMRIVVLLTAVKSALRARKRQTEVRDLLEKLERGVKERDAFLATLGHELRNPLGAIRNALELLDRVRAPNYAESTERVILRRQSHHLAHLVDDLLDVSRVTSGKIVLQRQATHLADIVRRGVDAISLGDRSAHEITLDLDPAPMFVHGDPVRLEQVVSNLLTNAIKYTPRGRRIDVGLQRRGGQAILTVADQGVGLAKEMIPRVFDLFSQAERSLDRADGGLGIGLTLVRRLVELHGGTIEAESEGVQLGSTFRVRLPLVGPPAEMRATPIMAELPRATRTRRVLLVEDNADIRETLGMLLQHIGFEVRVAVDGPTGVAAAEAEEPDAALVDIGLPGFDGYEVARRLRSAMPNLMLVALTGYGQPDDRRRSKEAGFDAHLTKPVDVDVLAAMLSA